MALFEFEDGRLVPAQFGRRVNGGFNTALIDAVCAQVLEIVSRPLFPITWRDITRMSDAREDGARLTALDASGQVVSVEIIDYLDSDVLIASLARLADTAALSWAELAREYPGDLESFRSGWIRFRDSMPPSPGSGPRLVMVAGGIDPTVRPALDILTASGIEVHEMSLRQMSNGRCFLEVHAVGQRLYGHATQLLLGRSGQEITVALEPGTAHTAAQVAAAIAPEVPAEEQSEVTVPAATVLAPIEDASDDAGVGAVSGGEGEAAAPDPDGEDEARESGAPSAFAEGGASEEFAAATDESHEATDGSHGVTDESGEGADESQEAGESLEVARARAKGVPVLDWDAAGLRTLAQIIAEDVPLHSSPLLELPQGVLLCADGTIRIGGVVHEDPTLAMAAINRADLDGWSQWRLVDGLGPTLAESIDEINREIVREYSRVPARGHRSRH
ncbi:hypothetical protein I6B53_01610 [Schaalia sp. 19OD2882]|nr:hypothetical protein I6B53_01610 [Schaalia sp. 19OD2882]